MKKKKVRIRLSKEIIEAEVEVEVLSQGICKGAIQTFIEEYIGSISGKGIVINKELKKKGGL